MRPLTRSVKVVFSRIVFSCGNQFRASLKREKEAKIMRTKRMASALGIALLAGVMCAGGTKLSHDGMVLFESSANVSYGATYSERCVKASVVGKEASTVSVRTDRKPENVFANRELLGKEAWSFDEKTGLTTLKVAAGATHIQFRFDGMTSIKPFTAEIPVAITIDGKRSAGAAKGECLDELFTSQKVWEGPSGIFEISLRTVDGKIFMKDCSVKVVGGVSMGSKDGVETAYLPKGSFFELELAAPMGKLPAVSIDVQQKGALSSVKAIDRVALLARKDIAIAEGEAFVSESVGKVTISKHHNNTSAGGCIFNWGTPGSRLEWDLVVPAAGKYSLAFVVAGMEKMALRSLHVNGEVVNGAAMMELPGTGGWGRDVPTQWQAYVPQAGGKDAVVELKAGKNRIALTNLLGQHLNLDCIVAIPVK